MSDPTTGRGRPLSALWLVARREVRERLRSKVFEVSTALSLVVLVIVVVAAGAASGDDDGTTYDVGVVGERPAAVMAAAETLVAGSDELDGDVELSVDTYPDAATARAAVRDGDVDAAVVDSAVVVDREIDPGLGALIEAADRQVAVTGALTEAGADPADVAAATGRTLTLDRLDPGTTDEDRTALASIGVVLLYGQLLGFGFWVASAIVEEKSSRVAELLLAKTAPWRLLAGKIAGIGVVGLLQLLSFVGGGLGLAVALGEIDLPPGTGRVAVEVVAWFVLGFALYSCFFAVSGAVASRPEELQGTTMPITLVAVGAFFAAMVAGDDPAGVVARVATFVPPAAPLVLPIRSAAGELPLWEGLVSVGLVLATIALVVPLAARIYAGGALPTRGRLGLRDALARAADRSDS
jgi:ABC-2 type transport system permease protein